MPQTIEEHLARAKTLVQEAVKRDQMCAAMATADTARRAAELPEEEKLRRATISQRVRDAQNDEDSIAHLTTEREYLLKWARESAEAAQSAYEEEMADYEADLLRLAQGPTKTRS